MMAYLSLSFLYFILLGLRFIFFFFRCNLLCFFILGVWGRGGELLGFGRLVLFLEFQEILNLVCSDTPPPDSATSLSYPVGLHLTHWSSFICHWDSRMSSSILLSFAPSLWVVSLWSSFGLLVFSFTVSEYGVLVSTSGIWSLKIFLCQYFPSVHSSHPSFS